MVLSSSGEVEYLIFANSPVAVLSLVFNVFMCNVHVRCSSNIRPRYFVLVVILIFCPLILKFIFLVIVFRLGLNIIISVLSTFNKILFALSQCTVSFRSWFMCLFSDFSEEWGYNKFVSSAKWVVDECLITLWISLMYIRNKSGPRTEP